MTSPCVCLRIPAFSARCYGRGSWWLQRGGISAHEANQTRSLARWPSAYIHHVRRRRWPIIFPAFCVCAPNSIQPFDFAREMSVCFLCDAAALYLFIYIRGALFLQIEKLKVNERQRAGEREMKSEHIRPQKPVLWNTKLDNEVVQVLISLHKHPYV